MVVTDQYDIGGVESGLKLLRIEERIVVAEGLAELTKVFAAAVRILGADFALHSGQGVELPGAAAGSQIERGCHIQFSVLSSQFSAVSSQLPLLDFCRLASLCSNSGASSPRWGLFAASSAAESNRRYYWRQRVGVSAATAAGG